MCRARSTGEGKGMRSKLFQRILIVFAISMGLTILLLVVTISNVAYNNAVERYERETRSAMGVFTQNMDYYFGSCVSAARAVYSDSELLSLLTKPRDTLPNQEERTAILHYLKMVHYACSSAVQIYMACPNLHQSYLYDPSVLMMTYSGIVPSGDLLPSFSSYLDVYIEPTNSIQNHGHKTLYFNQRQNKQVLSIWLPIYDLPKNSSMVATLAIDLTSDFLLNNSKLTFDSQEQIFISTQEGRIIAATDESWIQQNIDALLSPQASAELEEKSYTISDRTLVIAYDVVLRYCSWRLYKIVPIGRVFDETWVMISLCMILFAVLLILVFLINAQHIRRQFIPLQRITAYMQEVASSQSRDDLGSLSDYMHYDGHDEIQKLIVAFDWVMKAMEDYRIKQYELELAYDHSTYKMLQAQINPHFIYNTMQCFATNALRRKDIEQYRMLSAFGQMMHYAMVLNPHMVTLRQEIEYVERYVSLQRMRFGSEDQMSWHAEPESLRLSVPKMCLQPLVENSIVHGKLFQKPGARLEIFVECSGDWLCISVRDNGEPVSREKTRQIREKLERLRMQVRSHDISGEKDYFREATTGLEEHGRSGMIGVENVYNRLLLLFSDVEMAVYANDWGGTTVDLKLCLTSMKEEESHEGADCR